MTRIKAHINPRWPDAGTGNSAISTQLFHDRGQALFSAAVVGLAVALIPCPSAVGADRIVMRNLKVLTDRTVVLFDADGVKLDDGSLLTWDEIEKGTIGGGKQVEFDTYLRELGGPLYRIRQRLVTGDYEGLLAQAEQVYHRYVQRNSKTAYMVKQALMWGRLAAGQREAALEPYLRCLIHLSGHGGKVPLPGNRWLQIDLQTGLTSELVPIFFDEQAARESLPEVFRRIGEVPRPRPAGVYIYYVSLALAAGDDASAARVLETIPTDNARIAELRGILEAQREVLQGKPGVATAKLLGARDGISQPNRALALYWIGMSQLVNSERDVRRSGVLDLLRIPALHGQAVPELAAAALYHAMRELTAAGDARGGAALRRELLERFGQTYFAARARSAPANNTDTEETP